MDYCNISVQKCYERGETQKKYNECYTGCLEIIAKYNISWANRAD